MLASLLVVLLAGGLVALAAERVRPGSARWVTLAALGLDLALTVMISMSGPGTASCPWFADTDVPWIPRFGISIHLAVDGLSLLLLLLTFALGLAAVVASWRDITSRAGFFYLNLLWVLAGVAGVFVALDLFLFYTFWELMIIPMYFLIGIWGSGNRVLAATKFFIFTQVGGLAMLVAVLGLAAAHEHARGRWSFDYADLLGTPLSPEAATWLLLGFVLAFVIKLPAIPFHTWLPDAHAEAPTAGSVLLAGLLLKTGAYGLMRFAIPLFPSAAARIAPAAMALGAIGILYGAVLAFAQTDLKRMVAYTSVSHLGFVLLGVFAWNELALQGVVMQMIAHGLSTGALFVVAGFLYQRLHTRDLGQMGWLWAVVPRLAGFAMVFAMASLGLPGMANFVAEFLVLSGAFQVRVWITVVATVGLVVATIYALLLVQKVFHGQNTGAWVIRDLTPREVGVLVVLTVGLVWLGLAPSGVLHAAAPALEGLRGLTAGSGLSGGI
jgi:NADH-quinone oxidoreductase subunit M